MKKEEKMKLNMQEEKELCRAQQVAWMVFFGIGIAYFLVTLTLS